MDNVQVVILYDCLDVLHATVTHSNFISVEHLIKDVVFLEMGISNGYREDWPILVMTLLLYSGLNYITFRWRFFFFFAFVFLVACAWDVVN